MNSEITMEKTMIRKLIHLMTVVSVLLFLIHSIV